MGQGKYFDVGLFGETQEALGAFGSTFYLSLLLSQSCEQYGEIEEEYKRAAASQDLELMGQKEMELHLCQSTLAITAKMLESYHEINS